MSYKQVKNRISRQFYRLTFFVIQAFILLASTMTVATAMTNNTMEQHFAEQPESAFHVDLGIDSHYIDQGRNLLDEGGIFWGNAHWDLSYLLLDAGIGRATHQDYTELNIGMELELLSTAIFDITAGIQFIEIFGADRESDVELFTTFSYSGIDWFTPIIEHTYSLEANGHYVEISLQGMSFVLAHGVSVTPYVTQAFDYEFVVDGYNGVNHFQMGIKVDYPIHQRVYLSGHLSHITPQKGIKSERNAQIYSASSTDSTSKSVAEVNETKGGSKQMFAGIYLNWFF
jgi:hypothetical protein